MGSQTQEAVVRVLLESHLLILPSEAEALPVVLMEAQATGMPVIATNVGSVRQVLIDGQSGYMVPSKDVQAMCDKIEHLIRHPQLWEPMGRAGRRHIEENYDIKKLNLRLAELCKKL